MGKIDWMKLLSKLQMGASAKASEASCTYSVRLNQVGYRPEDEKKAVFVTSSNPFYVRKVDTGESVFEGMLSEAVFDAPSGDMIAIADFSELKQAGTFIVEASGVKSHPFRIGKDVYRDVADAVFRFFYMQRCGLDLDKRIAGDFAHDACHGRSGKVYGTDEEHAVFGGWHDAGDYGRYVSAAAKAVLDLLLAYQDYPDAYAQNAILDEVKYELDWMLMMQDQATGGVYHKVTSASFAPLDAMAGTNDLPMILSPISPTSTYDFAGVMAYASMIYHDDAMLAAAKKAWQYYENATDIQGFKNPEGIVTGEYGDPCWEDEKALAAVALYMATGDAAYHNEAKALMGKYKGLGWEDMGLYSAMLYLRVPENMLDDETYRAAKHALLSTADSYVDIAKTGYNVAIDSYPWGSNAEVASRGMVLFLAHKICKDKGYDRVAMAQLHYLLGQNACDKCFVTGFGENSVYQPHHRPSVALKKAMPGMLAGGPNPGLQDGVEVERLKLLPPAKAYIDHWDAYASNEVTIYWNSPLLYMLSAVL